VAADRLGLRALNRATLERQLLLRRAAMEARPAVGHLAGLQAQATLAPYVGLQARLAGFRHQQLKDLLTERAVVRAHLMRNTVHLLTAEDFVSFRPLFQPLMERGLAGSFGRNLAGVDLAELRAIAAALLSQGALTPRPVPLPPGNGATTGTLLVDGLWQADWKITRAKDKTILEIRPFIRLSAAETDAIAAEGELLLDFAGPAGTLPITGRNIRFCPGNVIVGMRASTRPVRAN